jgi:putative ubiquitin-RnfH superfamily antitoxin RatB of RatAB toxin-antitoxin module
MKLGVDTPAAPSASPMGPSTAATLLSVCVVYAEPETQWVAALHLEMGATVADAIKQSGCPVTVSEALGTGAWAVGIWGRRCSLDRLLRDGDQVEIYRPLHADAKQRRRARAHAAKRAKTLIGSGV